MKENRRNGLLFNKLLLDETNVAIIKQLEGDPRMGISDLARRVGMSAPSVRERLTRLEEAGIITGYRLELSPIALGWPITAFVRVKPMPGQLPQIAQLAKTLPQVAECHRITGEDCFIMKIYIDALENLDEILDKSLVYGQTTTSIVQSSPITNRPPPLPDL